MARKSRGLFWISKLNRLVFVVTALLVFVFGAAPTGLASHTTNNVPLDLEHTLRPNYSFGLSVFNVYWDRAWDANHPGATRATIDGATSSLVGSAFGARLPQYD